MSAIEAVAVEGAVPSLSELSAEFAPVEEKITSGLSSFWSSLSSIGKTITSGPGGKVLKVGAQVGSGLALPAAGIYELNKQTTPEQQAVSALTGNSSLGGLFPIAIVAIIVIIILIALFK